MPSLKSALASGLLAMCAGQAQAKWIEESANPKMQTPQLRSLQDTLPGVVMLDRRQQQNNVTASASIDLAKWEADTTKACSTALSSLTAATNPSGTSVCYNLISLDSSVGSGKFMADMRLFQVSDAFGDFAGVTANNVAARVAYSGASVMLVSDNAAAQLQSGDVLKVGKRQNGNAQAPKLIRTYMIAGTIDPDKLAPEVDKGLLESWVTPQVSLTARSVAGQQVTTGVTANEAIFVNGVFAGDVVLSDVARAQIAMDDATLRLQNGTAAFVVPGMNLLIEPIGLYITLVWTIIAFGIYGFGTYERYKHRDAYRRRKTRAGDNKGRI